MDLSQDQQYQPDLRWNFSLVVANGVAFRLVDTLIKPNLVLVVFLSQLTDNPIILGMPLALWTGGFMLSQLWISGRVQQRELALPLYRGTSLLRMALWLLVVVTVMFFRDAGALIAVVILFLIGYPLVWGVSGLAFFEVVGKTIPPRLRGPMFSMRMTFGGVLAIGGGWFVNRVLAEDFPVAFPQNFGLLFAAAAGATAIGLLPFHFMREPAGEPVPPSGEGMRGRWREIRAVWRSDSLFRHFVMARGALLMAISTSPLIIVFAQQQHDLPLNAAAVYLVADTIVGLIAVAASGWLSARLGNRWLAILATGLGLAAFGMVLLAGLVGLFGGAYLYFLVVFVLLAIYNSASAISFVALNLNIPPPDQRPLYIGLANTIFGTLSYLSIAQGILVAAFGYAGLFALATGLMAFGLWQIAGFLHDPGVEEEPVHG